MKTSKRKETQHQQKTASQRKTLYEQAFIKSLDRILSPKAGVRLP